MSKTFTISFAEFGQERLYAAALAVGALLWFFSSLYPSLTPFWAPWSFSWPEYLAMALTLLWYVRGLSLTPSTKRPPLWRRAFFFLGLGAIYTVLQTHFDYLAQHMFFINRIQHVVMHHFGPFLLALGNPGATIRRGMPRPALRLVDNRFVAASMRVLQNPFIAAFLFVGLFYFWLIPPIHFRAMLDGRLYALMNWSMVLDGILFWSLVLDPRAKPPARLSFGVRAALSVFVMFPQIILGALIVFSQHDIYPYYALCGRIFPSISAVDDQTLGGLVSWIPPAMMSVVALLLVLNFLRIQEEKNESVAHGPSPAPAPLAGR
jgi:putative membrane protein